MSEPKRISIWNRSIIGRNNVKALQQAVSEGADIHEIHEHGNAYNLLHCAAENGAIQNVVWLLEQGVDPTIKDALGRTAADCAREQHQEVVM